MKSPKILYAELEANSMQLAQLMYDRERIKEQLEAALDDAITWAERDEKIWETAYIKRLAVDNLAYLKDHLTEISCADLHRDRGVPYHASLSVMSYVLKHELLK